MYYVMSDIHGCHDEFMAALAHWNKETETLMVLGDLIDRGPDSLKVVQTLRELKETHGDRVVILKGNHDQSFTAWLLDTDPEELGHYYMPSHYETILSFFEHDKAKCDNSTRKQRGEHIRYLYMKELRFLHELPLYHETNHCIFVHAGINLNMHDWRLDRNSMNMIRNQFYCSRTVSSKKVFFGHTPTSFIRNDDSANDLWMSEHGDKIGIDGGVSMNGQLNALKVDEYGNITNIIVVEAGAKPVPQP